MSAFSVTRSQCEEFFFEEAALLDAWKLDEWLALFTDDGVYEIPVNDIPGDASASAALFYVADNAFRLRFRIERLKKTTAHTEHPRSTVFRMVSNVRLLAGADTSYNVTSKFITYRTRDGVTDCYFGHHLYRLTWAGQTIKIAAKRTVLDTGSLRPQGRISIIL